MVTLAVGCGGGASPDGLSVEGSVSVTVHQPGQADGSTGFPFSGVVSVDTPPATGHGFTGTCVQSGGAYTFTLGREVTAASGLESLTVHTGTGTTAPTVSLTVGTSTFSAGGTCTGTATPAGAAGVQFAIQCTGLTATNDPRTVDANINLSVLGCTGS